MLYGLIGERLGHSYSVQIHASIADYKYELKEIEKQDLEAFIKSREFNGINVTIPYKKSVIPYLDEVSETARKIGAVNTVVNKNGRLYGYNTDFYGMRELIRHAGINVENKKVLIFGTGGTSATARAAAESLSAREIINVSRSGKNGAVTYEQAALIHNDADIIINTTPSGMYPDTESCPADISVFKKLSGVVDAVYNPLKTRLVLEAQKRGIKAEGGLYMLAAQGVYASALFLGREVNAADIEKAYFDVLAEKRNIVLTGMPGAGKTTVGGLIAEATGKPFFDSDREIVNEIKMPVSDFFAQFGEPAFRKKEKEIIKRLSSVGGRIIATGGGAVLDCENIDALKQNGVIVFLDTPIEKIAETDDRPLSSTRAALEKRYAERYRIYCDTADIKIVNNSTAKQAADGVLSVLKNGD